MVTITISSDPNGNINKVECLGHAGKVGAGENIVCAAVSSITQTAALGLLMVANIQINLVRDEDKGYMLIELPQDLESDKQREAQIILSTMVCGLSDMYQDYSDYIELEVNK